MAIVLYIAGALTVVAGSLWTWAAFGGLSGGTAPVPAYYPAPAPLPNSDLLGAPPPNVNVFDVDDLSNAISFVVALPGLATILVGLVVMGLGHGLVLLGTISRHQRHSAIALREISGR